jgi:hypothetical protein
MNSQRPGRQVSPLDFKLFKLAQSSVETVLTQISK